MAVKQNQQKRLTKPKKTSERAPGAPAREEQPDDLLSASEAVAYLQRKGFKGVTRIQQVYSARGSQKLPPGKPKPGRGQGRQNTRQEYLDWAATAGMMGTPRRRDPLGKVISVDYAPWFKEYLDSKEPRRQDWIVNAALHELARQKQGIRGSARAVDRRAQHSGENWLRISIWCPATLARTLKNVQPNRNAWIWMAMQNEREVEMQQQPTE